MFYVLSQHTDGIHQHGKGHRTEDAAVAAALKFLGDVYEAAGKNEWVGMHGDTVWVSADPKIVVEAINLGECNSYTDAMLHFCPQFNSIHRETCRGCRWSANKVCLIKKYCQPKSAKTKEADEDA